MLLINLVTVWGRIFLRIDYQWIVRMTNGNVDQYLIAHKNLLLVKIELLFLMSDVTLILELPTVTVFYVILQNCSSKSTTYSLVHGSFWTLLYSDISVVLVFNIYDVYPVSVLQHPSVLGFLLNENIFADFIYLAYIYVTSTTIS